MLCAILEYEALRAVLALSGLTWPVDAVLVVGVLALLARRMRGGVGDGGGTGRSDRGAADPDG